jgi:hypothetical protein
VGIILGGEVRRGVAEQIRQRFQRSTRQERFQLGQLGPDLRRQCFFQRASQRGRVGGHEMAQPLLAPVKQTCNQCDNAIGIVVQPLEQPLPRAVVTARGVELRAGCFDIHRIGALDQPRQSAQLHRQRRLPHQRHAQRVDRVYLQARRMRDQIPAERRVTLQHRRGEMPGQSAVRFGRRRSRRIAQRGENALANFPRCLAREGHGDDRFGLLDLREQRKIALQQELGLTGTRGRVDDKRARDVQRPRAGIVVARGAGVTHRSHPRRVFCAPTRSGISPAGRSSCRAMAKREA